MDKDITMTFDELVIHIAQVLTNAKIPYMVSGTIADTMYGKPGNAESIDFALGINVGQRTSVQKLLRAMNLKNIVRSPGNFVRQTGVLPAFHEDTDTRIDFIFAGSDFEVQSVEHAVTMKYANEKIRFITVEDLIIHKVFSGEQADYDDGKKILQKHKKIQVRYIEQWLKYFEDKTERSLRPIFSDMRKGKK